MRTNIFKIESENIDDLRDKLTAMGMVVIQTVSQNGWAGEFWYSTEPDENLPVWAKDFAAYFDGNAPKNKSFFAAFFFTKGDESLVLCYGRSHFYVRPFCDYDFGIEVAKRIAQEQDVRQTATKRFNTKQRKDIRSYEKNSAFDVSSGESIDFIQAGIRSEMQDRFGKTGKFGTSVSLATNLAAGEIGGFLDELVKVLNEPANFAVPRTISVSEQSEVERLNNLLLDELQAPVGQSELTHSSYDLWGVDFVFTNDGSFVLTCSGFPRQELESLSMAELKQYILENSIPRERILDIKVKHKPDGSPGYTESLKGAIDFIPEDGSRTLLTNGKWVIFNQDYLDALDEALASITVLTTEEELAEVSIDEPTFNLQAADYGYEVADKDFSLFRTRATTPVEAWDLRLSSTVYAVKFGTPQKLGYVCDQAFGVLEIIRNSANLKEVPDFERYCLWLGYKSKTPLTDITKTGSIIFKQKIDAWARRARDLGVEPVLKFSHKVSA